MTESLRSVACRILQSPQVEDKLHPIGEVCDDESGSPFDIPLPARIPQLQFVGGGKSPKMPAAGGLGDPAKRAVAHHIMANHELQALEVMAWVLLRFPKAPPAFRTGLIDVMRDEQRHTRMHVERARHLGLTFGDYPVNGHIWKKSRHFQSLLDYLAGLPLVFEGRNLDHSLEFATAFERAGDARSAALMRRIHDDEIEHVRFGIEWLRRLKPADQSDWDVWQAHLHWPLRPSKAKGDVFQREARIKAGLDADLVERLAQAQDEER